MLKEMLIFCSLCFETVASLRQCATETLGLMQAQGKAKDPTLINQMKGTMRDNFQTFEGHVDEGMTENEKTMDKTMEQFEETLEERWLCGEFDSELKRRTAEEDKVTIKTCVQTMDMEFAAVKAMRGSTAPGSTGSGGSVGVRVPTGMGYGGWEQWLLPRKLGLKGGERGDGRGGRRVVWDRMDETCVKMLGDARRPLIHDTAKRCAMSLEAYHLVMLMCHFLSFARCSRWPLPTWTASRTGLMIWWPCRQAERPLGCYDHDEERRVGSLLSPLHDIVGQRLHLSPGPRHEHPQPCARGFEALAMEHSLATEVVAEDPSRNSKAVSPSFGAT